MHTHTYTHRHTHTHTHTHTFTIGLQCKAVTCGECVETSGAQEGPSNDLRQLKERKKEVKTQKNNTKVKASEID